MPSFRIKKPYTMPREEVREATLGLAEQLERKHGVTASWEDDHTVSINASGVHGRMSFGNGVIDISVKLGLMAAMFERVMKKEVTRYLDEHVT
ncbi:MAG: polyhydroxyalkanoic acid system family protein [Halioglobus sp.]|nr:polyhydroxyalkanoic acid system family protein [Halioglobus sp.]